MLTVHHLGRSQSERIVWLCEELGIPYDLRRYDRDPVTILSPPELRALHPLGAAPLVSDGDLLLAESGAIVEYIIHRHGGGRLALAPPHSDYAQYLYWFHFANGNLQSIMVRLLTVRRLEPAADNPVLLATQGRLDRALAVVEARVKNHAYLAGQEFTAADIMLMFSLSTMRSFVPVDFTPYPSIRAYLHRLADRPAYRNAMQKGDPGMALLLD